MRGWWWLWSCCPGIGAVRMASLRGLARELDVGPDELWGWTITQLRQALNWPDACLAAVDQFRQRKGLHPDLAVPSDVLLPGDRNWPTCLDHETVPPPALHCCGRKGLLSQLQQRQAVAVVGTRAASDHGISTAQHLGQSLAAAGWPVLSGLAEGIDAAAHRGCLAMQGAAVAVLGTPLDRVYPRHHRTLQAKIGQEGLLLTTHASGTSVRPGHFAARNRLLVVFARAVVVVECPERSGALITARFASEQGCPIWSVPGDISRWSCRGSNALLKDQAKPLLCPDDLLSYLGPGPLQPSQGSERERALLRAIGPGASLPELVQRLKIPAGELATLLLAMESRGKLLCESGFRWRQRSS